MRVLIAVDSFKGSLGSAEAGAAIAAGIRSGFSEIGLQAEIEIIPTADGGEGTIDAFASACGGEKFFAAAPGPFGDPVRAESLLLPDRKVILFESAQTCGLTLVAPRTDILHANTAGLGRQIKSALDRKPERIWIGLGGSATNDWGAGMAAELGVRFLDAGGQSLSPRPFDLAAVRSVDLGGLDDRIRHIRFTVLADVDNPLLGPRGAAAVFGPQKGADTETVRFLDETGGRYADAVEAAVGHQFRDVPGAGAAGGLGFAGLSLLGADLRPGIAALIEAAEIKSKAKQADLIITGEGRLDSQSRRGKTVWGISALARETKRPCIAYCGSVAGAVSDYVPDLFAAVYPLIPEAASLEDAMARAAGYLENIARRAARDLAGFIQKYGEKIPSSD